MYKRGWILGNTAEFTVPRTCDFLTCHCCSDLSLAVVFHIISINVRYTSTENCSHYIRFTRVSLHST